MAKQTDAQKHTVGRVMHEFKQGELESRQGGRVRDPKQAIAIALSEAGVSDRQSPEANRRHKARAERRERGLGPTRAELYEEATRRGIAGRSRMDKAALQRALRRAQEGHASR